jgi:hypothetical protein
MAAGTTAGTGAVATSCTITTDSSVGSCFRRERFATETTGLSFGSGTTVASVPSGRAEYLNIVYCHVDILGEYANCVPPRTSSRTRRIRGTASGSASTTAGTPRGRQPCETAA